jgi:hypothetical protein
MRRGICATACRISGAASLHCHEKLLPPLIPLLFAAAAGSPNFADRPRRLQSRLAFAPNEFPAYANGPRELD